MTIIAQLSDIHLAAGADGRVDDRSGPVRALRSAVSSLLALPQDRKSTRLNSSHT